MIGKRDKTKESEQVWSGDTEEQPTQSSTHQHKETHTKTYKPKREERKKRMYLFLPQLYDAAHVGLFWRFRSKQYTIFNTHLGTLLLFPIFFRIRVRGDIVQPTRCVKFLRNRTSWFPTSANNLPISIFLWIT